MANQTICHLPAEHQTNICFMTIPQSQMMFHDGRFLRKSDLSLKTLCGNMPRRILLSLVLSPSPLPKFCLY